MSKLPFMKFYPADWLTAPGLRACSLEARGFWFDILCLMWKCPKRGVLRTGKEPWGVREISYALNLDPAKVQELLNELLRQNVCEKLADGSLVSRRIRKDEKRRKYWRNKQKEHRTKDIKHDVKQKSTVEIRDHISEVRSKSSSEEDPTPLLAEIAIKYPSNREHFEFAVRQIRNRSNGPPRSLAYWRKSLTRFFENWEEEVAAYEREQAERSEARAGHNPYGRAN